MNEDIYYSIKAFISKLENTQFTFDDATQAAKIECEQMSALKQNIIEVNSETNSEGITFIIDQLDRYIIKLKKLIGEIPVSSIKEKPTLEEIKKEREEVLKLLQGLNKGL